MLKEQLYQATNQAVLKTIPQNVSRILDLGCGTGSLGRVIKARNDCEVVGITSSIPEAKIAAEYLDQVIVEDLNSLKTMELGKFDCIVCSHILEHLYDPEKLLLNLHENLTSDGLLIVALPNILHWRQRLVFLSGKFEYTDGGLMDRTHVHFYDWKTSVKLLQDKGFVVISHQADGYFPLPILRPLIPILAGFLDRVLTRFFPGLLGVQFITILKPYKP
jgi:2-polyprenyl-3-methyl-5-hydroxy-6-metoxy-1,4-benzoquinol methylase